MRELTPIRPVPPIQRDMDIMANRLASTTVLAGETISLQFEDGATLSMELAATHICWDAKALDGRNLGGEDAYDAVEMRPGIFFVDYALADGSMAFSHVIDREKGRALTVWSELANTNGAPDLREFLRPATVLGHPAPGAAIEETRELLGKRLFCEYSRAAALEHIYVNSATIIWQWLLGPPELTQEVGIEAVTMWKIRDRLYLISTRGNEPIQLTLLLDLERMRNVGRLFGRSQFGPVDRRCGAKITYLGDFAYPKGYQPG
jgi:hypothetical protein